MTRQLNIRIEEDTYQRIQTEAQLKGVSVSFLLKTAFWCLVDTLYDGDEYDNKISSLKRAVEYTFRH